MFEFLKVDFEEVHVILFVFEVELEDFEELFKGVDMLNSNWVFVFSVVVFVFENSFNLLNFINRNDIFFPEDDILR